MSRVPRFREHLKTGFTAEAATAATFRAYAARAEESGRPNLAQKWLDLAAQKDTLAVLQLEASGTMSDAKTSLRDAVAEENYENDVLYPKMIRDLDGEPVKVFQEVVEAQREHLKNLEQMRAALQASEGDI